MTVSDSVVHGVTIHEIEWDLADVLDVGQTSEHWRYRILGTHRPQERALLAAGLETYLGSGHSDPLPVEVVPPDNFCEVPCKLISDSTWKLLKGFRWKGTEPIHVKEARGPLFCLRRICKSRRDQHSWYVFLCDNIDMVFALQRGRAFHPKVLSICRRRCAFRFACNIRA